MEMGTTRVETIVLSLRSFSRLDESALKSVNIHEGLESTLLVLQSRLAKIQVVKDYGELPLVECYAGKLNQVFLNILGNAIDALETANQPCIQIRTYQPQPGWIGIAIADNGSGIQPEIETKLFDPFFTTKPVGKGTGLGLSISYQIIVNEHEGTLLCHSTPQSGAEFVIEIPVQQSGSG
jgi:two-component system, NtrC family, sensor kinase